MMRASLLSSGFRHKGHGTHNASIFFSSGRLCPSSWKKNTVFQDSKYGELEIINAHMSQCVCGA